MIQSKFEYRESPRKISIYNSLGGEKRPFEPLDTAAIAPVIKMYVCGLTPQDHSHVGHGLTSMRFDIVRRYLAYRRLNALFVQNVTDIDDKIIEKVKTTGEDPLAMTRRYSDEFYECLSKLHLLPVSKLTRVTECVPRIITFIEELISKGFAYATPEGSVYFDVAKKSDYGKLSNQNTAMLYESVRKELDKQKRSPLDFALWKRDESSALSHPSPWGIGRPGWHIECSVMIHEELGDHIDIHGGGLDLKFPHHENEIAQSEAFAGGCFARVWMHSGLLNIEGQKMSKSLNNFIKLTDAIERFGTAPLKFVVARHHYRSTLDLAEKLFRENLNSLLEFHRLIAKAPAAHVDPNFSDDTDTGEVIAAFEQAMDNDFNSPEALVALEQFRGKIVAALSQLGGATPEIAHRIAVMRELGGVLGLFNESLDAVETQGLHLIATILGSRPLAPSEIDNLLRERLTARGEKNFARSDEIRSELATHGVEVLDSKVGSSWRFA